MACIEITATNITAPHLDISATRICAVSEGDKGTPSEFSFRMSGSKSILDGVARIKELQGNAVVWNQLVNTGTTSVSLNSAHKYVTFISGTTAIQTGISSVLVDGNTDKVYDLTLMFGVGNEPTTVEEFYARCPIGVDLMVYIEGELIPFNADAIKSVGDNVLDIDRDVADVPYATLPTSIQPVDYSVIYGAMANDGYGRNDYNLVTKLNNGIRVAYDSAGYGAGIWVKVLPNETYNLSMATAGSYICYVVYTVNKVVTSRVANPAQFTTPSGCTDMMLVLRCNGGTSADFIDIMLTLVHSGWKVETDGVYKPYESFTRKIDPRIKEAFPNGMKPWDKVYNKNGKGYIVKGSGEVDLGSLIWNKSSIGRLYSTSLSNLIVKGTCGKNQAKCSYRYAAAKTQSLSSPDALNESIWVEDGHRTVAIKDDSVSDPTEFISDWGHLRIFYELAEPEVIEYDEPFNLDYQVWDFGTEEITGERLSAPISANIAYVFKPDTK